MNLNESIMKKFNLNQNVIKNTYVFFISFLFLLFSCESDDGPSVIKVKGVTLDNTEDFKLKVGDTRDLGATIDPDNAANQKVTYNSSSYDVAKVSNSGKVTALSAGTATISVTTKDGSKTAEATVTVTERIVLAEGINFGTQTSLELTKGGTKDLSLFTSVTPSNVTSDDVDWKSSSTKATVSDAGLVTAVSAGDAVITATAKDGSEVFASIEVVVVAKVVEEVVLVATAISFPGTPVTPISLEVTGEKELRSLLVFEPANATSKNISWGTSLGSKATVTDNGKVVGVSGGTATITATLTKEDGTTDTAEIVVVVVAEEVEEVLVATAISFPGTPVTPISLEVTGEEELRSLLVFEPADATSENISWSTSLGSKATVTDNGKVTGVSEGSATITATLTKEDGTVDTAEIVVNVTVNEADVVPAVSGLEFDSEEIDLIVNRDKNLRNLLTVLPVGANQEVSWESDNNYAAEVDPKTGLLETIREGEVVITATSVEDSTKKATITVTVGPVLAKSVVIDGDEIRRIEPADDVTLKATVSPSNAEQDVTWAITEYSLGDDVWVVVDDTNKDKAKKIAEVAPVAPVTVKNTGKVTAATITTIPKPLKVKVQATSKDGLVTSNEVTVIVSYATDKIEIDQKGIVSGVKGSTQTLTAAITTVTTATGTVATNAIKRWSSKDPAKATVDQKGVVTFKELGDTTITVEIDTEGGDTESDEITVRTYAAPLVGIAIKHDSDKDNDFSSGTAKNHKVVVKNSSNLYLKLKIGDTKDLDVGPVPSASQIVGKVVWSSADKTKVTVNSLTGIVRAVASTSTDVNIIATGSSFTSTVKVKVEAVSVTGVSIGFGPYKQLAKSATATIFESTVVPANATDKTVTWAINAAGIVTVVPSTGVVTPVGEGKVVLTAATSDGKTATIDVEVVIPVTEIGNITSDTDAESDGSYKLTAGGSTLDLDVAITLPVYTPTAATKPTHDLKWVSSNEAAATVDKDGVVTAIATGTTIITVSRSDLDYVSPATPKKVTIIVE